ncbi:MAG: hypothetical protein CL441_09465 [Acidimicrobiaceae bacterium]|nr:hypothetical protein [Acidimicrobiaceae bacterium]
MSEAEAVQEPGGTGMAPDAVEAVPRRAWLALGVSTLAALLTVIDISIVNVAFPSIRRDLGASETGLSWVLSGYSVAVGAFLLVAGRLADQRGRRRMFLLGVGVFVAASLLCGLAASTGLLIASRVLQGIGSSVIGPTSLSMVLPEFPASRRSMVLGIWGASAALGAALGPSVGAVLLEYLSWRWVFLVNVPIGLALLALTPRYVRETRDPDATGRFDVVGLPAGTLGVALVLVAIVQGGDWGYGSSATVASAVAGFLLIVLLVVRSMRHPEPLLDLELFRIRSFWSAASGQVFFTTSFIAIILFNSLVLQEYWGWAPLAAGFGVVPGPALASLLGGPVGSIADRVGHRNLLVFGCAMAGMAPTWLLWRIGADGNYVADFLPAQLFLGVGVSCTFATFGSLGLREVSPARFGTASATLRTTSTMGFAVGVALGVAVFDAALPLGPLVAFDRTWTVLAGLMFAGSLFCAAACPPRRPRG